MTTSPVMTVTDELLAELEEAAKNACSYGKDDWFKLDDLRHDIELDDAKYVATSSPFVIVALTAELRRLRAENAALEQSLAESRANDQAAMGWLTYLRWASGDRGERMLPELVEHIEGLAKDAGRLDLLDSLCESYGFQDVHEGNRWVIDGPFRDIRTAADSLEAQ